MDDREYTDYSLPPNESPPGAPGGHESPPQTRAAKGGQQSQGKNTEWRNNFQGLKPDMLKSKLLQAVKYKNKTALEKTIREYLDSGADGCPELECAEKQLDILNIKAELQAATANKNTEEIIEVLEKIRDKLDSEEEKQRTARRTAASTSTSNTGSRKTQLPKMDSYKIQLAYELQQARTVLSVEASKPERGPTMLKMDSNTMAEIKSYKNPPVGLHAVMKAALLLLGETEDTTAEWRGCLRMCNSLNKRILSFDMDTVEPEIAARARQIINTVDFQKIQNVSAGGSTFYVWVKGTLEDYEATHSLDGVTPANKKRQQEILEPEAARAGKK